MAELINSTWKTLHSFNRNNNNNNNENVIINNKIRGNYLTFSTLIANETSSSLLNIINHSNNDSMIMYLSAKLLPTYITINDTIQSDNNLNYNYNFNDQMTNDYTTNQLLPLQSQQQQQQQSFETLQKIVSIIVPILFAVIVIVGLVGNSLVVIVVKCNPQMYSTTNLLIINLAIADLLFIIFCVPFTAWDYVFPYWPFGSVWCKIVQYLIVVCAYASIYTLVLMSLDRYLAVAHPIRSLSLRTVKNANRAILILWIFILLFCIPAFITHNVSYDNSSDIVYSVCNFLNEEYNYALYQVVFCLFSYIIPILLILILYVLMLKRLWFSGIPGRNMSHESVRSKKKVTRMVVIVVIIFACCWCPIQIILVLRSFNIYELSTTKVIIQITGQVLAYMNSCMNPILYAFLSENFRKAFRRVISCSSSSNHRRKHHANKRGMNNNNNNNNDNNDNNNKNIEQTELTIGMCIYNNNNNDNNNKNFKLITINDNNDVGAVINNNNNQDNV